jgi:plasmid stabilization system protein ParE
MSLPVVLRDEALAEFDDAFDFYEGQRPGLGVTFAAHIQEVFDRIGSNPTLHAVVFADIRKAAVARFPYRVYYRVEAAKVQVIAVFHTARDPAIWQGRA